MERLTKKNDGNTPYIQKEYPYLASADINDITNKLGKLEDLEEELGIPLEVLFKALKNGVYAKFEEGKILETNIKLYYSCDNEFKIRVVCLEIGQYEDFEWEDYLFVKNYGKTWALTKEELE